jgi:hypothetical protein
MTYLPNSEIEHNLFHGYVQEIGNAKKSRGTTQEKYRREVRFCFTFCDIPNRYISGRTAAIVYENQPAVPAIGFAWYLMSESNLLSIDRQVFLLSTS